MGVRTLAKTRLTDLKNSATLVWQAGRRDILVIATVTSTLSLMPAGTLWVSKLLLDDVARAVTEHGRNFDHTFRVLVGLLGLQVALAIGGTILGTINGICRELLADRLQHGIGRRILEKAASLEVERFEDAETYDALRNAYAEVGSRPLAVVTQCLVIGQALITLGSVGTLIARIGPGIIPLALLASLPGVLVSVHFGKQTHALFRRRAPEARLQNYLASLLTSDTVVKEVRLFGFEQYLLAAWERHHTRFRSQLVPLLRRRSMSSLGASLLSSGLIALATVSVLRRAAEGVITVGDFSLFVAGIGQVQGQFAAILGSISGMYENLLYMRNLFEFMELPSRDLDAGEEWQGPIERVEFEHVTFRYPLTNREVLRDVSFRIERGEALAIVGTNGAGKTTIVKLLARLFEPSTGRVLLNGKDASLYSPRSVQREMSVIMQDYGHYQMTARENIGLSLTSALGDDDAVQRAAVESNSAGFVDALPERYETILGRLFPGGQQLSGGQWQRLALGRLYFRPASVLIFDEPTAALDAVAEVATIERLRARDDRITLIISHRFSTVRSASQVLVLERGKSVEQGSHEELMAKEGHYAKWVSVQADAYQSVSRETVT